MRQLLVRARLHVPQLLNCVNRQCDKDYVIQRISLIISFVACRIHFVESVINWTNCSLSLSLLKYFTSGWQSTTSKSRDFTWYCNTEPCTGGITSSSVLNSLGSLCVCLRARCYSIYFLCSNVQMNFVKCLDKKAHQSYKTIQKNAGQVRLLPFSTLMVLICFNKRTIIELSSNLYIRELFVIS